MWMYTLLPKILNMSLTAGIVIVLVLISRILLRKAPKIFSYVLWVVVLFRLVCPVSFSSEFSLMGLFHSPAPTTNGSAYSSIDYIPDNIVHTEFPEVDLPIPIISEVINNNLPQGPEQLAAEPLEGLMALATLLWLLGIAGMLIYSAISLLLLCRKLIGSVRLRDNIYLADHIVTPFVIGIFRAKIYLPSNIAEHEQDFVILHEQTHIRRFDHIIKMLAFLALSVHWFNPLVWVAFISCVKDMEMSCDERVLKEMGGEVKSAYSASLLSLATGQRLINGSPLAFGEGNIKERIKNVMNFKKPATWVIAVSVILILALSISFATNRSIRADDEDSTDTPEVTEIPAGQKQPSEMSTTKTENENNSGLEIDNVASTTEYNRVKITFLSENIEFKSTYVELAISKIVAYIDSVVRTSLTPAEEIDLKNNHTNQYTIELSNEIGGYSCGLYYDTLYNKAYIVNNGGLYEADTDFARYIDSFFENTNITVHIDDADAVELFHTYGWTLDYQINAINSKLNNIKVLTGFNPNAYYFAYNNELSKDIGLDMSGYSNNADIDVEIYKIHESMPQEFYPIQDGRGIVVKSNDKIIGAFISAGRHSAFNACSLKGNSFDKVTGQALNEWLTTMIQADSTDERLSKLQPEQVIEEYFTALNQKYANTARYCMSKRTLLGKLTSNMPNDELFYEGIGLPFTDSGVGEPSRFDNLKSIKLLKSELIDEPDNNTKIFRVTINPQYNKETTISSGEQSWDCRMIYESPQTGWKIESFGH